MKLKSETRKNLTTFFSFIENQFSTTLKYLRSDNGPEFLMHDVLNSKGILHQLSCVEGPQQNGLVERKYQHILNVARALSFQANLPTYFWNFSIQHVVHLINRIPFPLLKNKSPFQLLYNKSPTLLHLKSFGCLAFVYTLHAYRTKFDSRARKTVFLGFRNGTKGYLLYDLNSREFVISRNAIFYETAFPLHIPSPPQTTSPHIDLLEPYPELLIPPPTTTPLLPYDSSMTEPKTYNQACKSPSWANAMQNELSGLASTNTWSIVTLPPNNKPIGCKWVYKIKYNADGSI